jgi:integrase
MRRVVAKFTAIKDKSGNKIPHLFRISGTDIIYVRKSFKRLRIKPLFASTGETTTLKAKARAEEMINDHLNELLGIHRGHISMRFGTRSVHSVIDEINEVETPTLRKRSQIRRKHFFGIFKEEFGTMDISRVNLERWSNWLRGYMRRSKRTTFKDFPKNMNIVLRYAYEQQYVSHLISLPNPDAGKIKRKARVYTPDELGALYNVMNDDTKLQFVLSYQCYMRLREVLYLTWDRIDFKTGEITLNAEDVKTGSRTGKGRIFKASSDIIERLKERRLSAGPSRYVFPSPVSPNQPIEDNKKAWIGAKKRAGIKGKATWHEIRHTAITHALMIHGVEPMMVSEFAGVSVATIQRVYLHSTAEHTKRAGEVLRISIAERREKGVNNEMEWQ